MIDVVEPLEAALHLLKFGPEAHDLGEGADELARQQVDGEQRAERQRTVHHAQPAEPQDDDRIEHSKKARGRRQRFRRRGKTLARVHHARDARAPALHEGRLRPGSLQRLDEPDAGHRGGEQFALRLQQHGVGVGAAAVHRAQRDDIEGRHDHANQRQDDVVAEHQSEEEDSGD